MPVDFSSAVVMAVCIGTSALGSVLLGATGFGPAIVFHVAIAVLEMWTHHIANDAVVITLITLPMCVTLLIITVLAWKDISWALYTLMVIPAALFIPVGTLLLLKLDPAPVRQGVGILVLAFAVYRFFFAVRLWDLNRRRRRAAQRAGGGSAGDGGAKPSSAGVASAVDSLLLHGDGQQGGFGTTTGGHDASQCRGDGDAGGGGGGGDGAAAVTGSDSVAISTDTEPAAPPALPTPAAANSGASASPWRSPPSPGSHRSQRSHRSHRFYRSPRGRNAADDRRRMSYGSAPRRVRSSASFDSGIVSRVGGSVSPGGGSAILRQRSGRWGSADGDWQWPGDEPARSIFHTGPPAAPMKLADIPLLRVVCARVVACPCLCAWCPCRRCRPEACGWPSKGVMIGTVITGAWVGFLLGLVGIPGLPLMVLVTSLKMKKSVTRATVSAVLATVHPVQVSACGSLFVWLWLCGGVDVWMCGCVDVWMCGCMAVAVDMCVVAWVLVHNSMVVKARLTPTRC